MDFNIARAFDAASSLILDRVALIDGDQSITYEELRDHACDWRDLFLDHGLGFEGPLLGPATECSQPRVALYMRNRFEHLAALLGAFAARAIPVNVNYRYRPTELRHLFMDASVGAIAFDASFVKTVADVVGAMATTPLLIGVDDASRTPLPDTVIPAPTTHAGPPGGPIARDSCTADDRYVLYTGGTTGTPKGVVWRQGDIFAAILDGREGARVPEFQDYDEIASAASTGAGRVLAAPPFMHGAGQWAALATFQLGQTLVIQRVVERFDASDICRTIDEHHVTDLVIVGDAFARPLLDVVDAGSQSLQSLQTILNVGAFLHPKTKHRLLEAMPGATLVDGAGASEMGGGITQVSRAGDDLEPGVFGADAGTCVVSEDLSRVEHPGHAHAGWLAKSGRIPLGYLGDAAKTAKTFPTVAGTRYSVPGDRALHRDDGEIVLLGRDSVTITTGGEKVFAEEVERVICTHPSVRDVLVVGLPSERWGHEIVAVVEPNTGASITLEDIRALCRHELADYKSPKSIVCVAAVQRSPAGKADYRWAGRVAANARLDKSTLDD